MELYSNFFYFGFGETHVFCDPLMIACCFAGLGLTLSFLTLGNAKLPSSAIELEEETKEEDSPTLKRRVLFVIAHPDDECMFFGPTILHFTKKNKNNVYLLCLSSGDFYKEGKRRSKELWMSCDILGIPAENVILYRCDDLPDNPSMMWPTMHTSLIIGNHIHSLDINMVFTFDSGGVSGHINHFAVFNAVEHLVEEEELPNSCEVYCLESVNVLRKYSSVFDIFLSYSFSSCAFTASCRQIGTIKAAMKAHQSQYLWFRRLYVIFSRYMLINTMTRLK